MELITLYATREQASWYNIITTLKDDKGKVKAIYSSNLRQPKRGTKTIVVNCCKYLINWDAVKKKVRKTS
jgi:hypothetical protein